MTLKSITQSLTAQGIAIAALGGTVYPAISTPLKNIASEVVPTRKVVAESAIDIIGQLLVAGGASTALVGRIRAGGVSTPKGLYGPDPIAENPEKIEEKPEEKSEDKSV